jgi:hypothetical protein
MPSRPALPDRGADTDQSLPPTAAELSRLLRAGRRILVQTPDTKVVLALKQAAGCGKSRQVLMALNQLDAITLHAYQSSIFDFEDRLETDRVRVLGIFDSAIAAVEASRDRRSGDRRSRPPDRVPQYGQA